MKLLFLILSIISIVATIELKNIQSNSIKLKGFFPSIDLPLNGEGKTDFTTFLGYFGNYNLTQGEIRSIFRLCDKNQDDSISPKEWSHFRKLFIRPFEQNCLCGDKPLIKDTCLEKCIKKTKLMQFIGAKKWNPKIIYEILDRENENNLNFNDYIFLRRANFAWKECSVDNKLNKKRMECALTATTPQKRKFLPVANQVFNIANKLFYVKNSETNLFLNFFDFLRIAHLYYYFNEYELPFQDEYLSKRILIKGISDQIMPNSFDLNIINEIYEGFDPEISLDFGSFASLAHFHKIYIRILGKNKEFSQNIFEKFLKEKDFNDLKNNQLLNIIMVEDKDYNVFEKSFDEEEVNEREYFTRFLQKENSVSKKVTKVIFNMLDFEGKKNLRFKRIILFVKLAWVFQFLDNDDDGYIDAKDISTIKNYKTILPLTLDEKKKLNDLGNFIENYSINFKQFLSYFTYESVFSRFLLPDNKLLVSKINVNSALKLFGLKSTNHTENTSQENNLISSYSSFNYEKAFKEAIKQEITIVRIIRMQNSDKNANKLNKNIAKEDQLTTTEYFEKQKRTFRSWKPSN